MEEQVSPIFALASIFILGYLLGSVPCGLLIGKFNGVDIRTKGSKNIGATNVTRVVGPGWGKVCFALDFLKGSLGVVLAVWLSGRLGYDSFGWAKLAGCAGALVGHIYPFWLNFKGGKGVATGAGAAFAMAMWPVVFGLLVWALVFLHSRIVAKASIIAVIAAVIMALFLQISGLVLITWPVVALIFAMAALIVYRHKDNIKRMMEGKENAFKK